jgi:hypothetical protein
MFVTRRIGWLNLDLARLHRETCRSCPIGPVSERQPAVPMHLSSAAPSSKNSIFYSWKTPAMFRGTPYSTLKSNETICFEVTMQTKCCSGCRRRTADFKVLSARRLRTVEDPHPHHPFLANAQTGSLRLSRQGHDVAPRNRCP